MMDIMLFEAVAVAGVVLSDRLQERLLVSGLLLPSVLVSSTRVTRAKVVASS